MTEYYNQPYFVIWVIYSLIPFLDQIVPPDNTNPTPEEEKLLKSQWKWKIPIYLFIFMEWVTLLWSFSYISRNDLSLLNYLVFVLALSNVSAIGFLFSHELFHKKDTLGKVVGTFDMLKNLYMHFYSEHLYGHHKYVSTPEDPATAAFGQTLYSFIPKSITGSFRNTWNREGQNMLKQKKSFYSLENKMIQWLLIEAAFVFSVWFFLGNKCLGLFLAQAFLSTCLLETINYIRHYGLLRKKMKNGQYEPVTTKHSWNAPQTVQNCILLKLQRHSDHHANAYKPYQILQSCEDSPNLPCGYAVCVLASLFPWAWFSIVNPLAEATNKTGKPSEEQMKKSTDALKVWLVAQVVVTSAVWGLLSINA
jgi:alkane 1-monooxygenase